MNTDVCPPGPPVCTTFSPGARLNASGTVRRCSRSICAESMTVTELPTSAIGSGVPVALIVTSGSSMVSGGGRFSFAPSGLALRGGRGL